MTDARFPDRWLFDIRLANLSDSEFRSFAMAMIWAVGTRTDGHVPQAALKLIPGFSPGSVSALVGQGLWIPRAAGEGWDIAEFIGTQTSRSDLEVLERARRADREKKRRQRAAKAYRSSESQGQSPGTNEGTTQERTGEERTGKDGGEVSWPVARIPDSPELWLNPETGVLEEVI